MSLDDILEGFDASEKHSESALKDGGAVTIWLPAAYKAKYDRLQTLSQRRFCKKMRELIQAAIDMTESKSG